MGKIELKIVNQQGEVRQSVSGDKEAALVYKAAYEKGDRIEIHVEEVNTFYWLQTDECVGKSMVYLTGDTAYEIPFGEGRRSLSPKAFEGERHLVSIRRAWEFEYQCYRNLSMNVNDQHGIRNVYPHAAANVETRGEAVFAAMNAIDGTIVPQSHGNWPYESWGINRREDACWRLDFGRTVVTDRIVVYLRADFPHDSWWEEGKVTFSDGTDMKLKWEKGGHGQSVTFEKKEIQWLELSELKKADDLSPFPALTQIEVYGIEK